MTGQNVDKTTMAAAVLLERMIRDTYSARHSSEIQPLQWSILRYLARTPEDQRQLRRIAPFLNLTPAPVARAITTLAQRGLVTQSVSAADSRIKTITLTNLGLEALLEDPIVDVAARIDALPDLERMNFIRSVRTLALGTALDTNPAGDAHDKADTSR
ncbi:MarR family winged helix-turn-helix transcriptional regulator [Pseudosulfitobacter sp. DSM 107133]|uniref:MarR family winged helix-turn-helix transcriptional regulator n=1 Tax=Pseudosulfitobacter sp. DSM 107133 TaxID=2883100 RepID=UPI0013B3A05D|nr:MarR family winged helix-turn-helix transcriptional regulator [Pseudosulfitobacter sp. DSM 107133]